MPEKMSPILDEVICGVSFAPVSYFKPFNYGSIVDAFSADGFTETEEQPPIVGQFENKNETRQVIVEMRDNTRIWMSNPQNHELFQFQLDRFLFNWRSNDGEQEYQNFHTVLLAFSKGLSRFIEVVSKKKKNPTDKELALNQLELTYLNNLYELEHWQNLNELEEIFPFFRNFGSFELIKNPETFRFGFSFRRPELEGRVHVTCATAVHIDGRKLLQVNFTARGMRESDTFDTAPEWFARAHDAIHSISRGIISTKLLPGDRT